MLKTIAYKWFDDDTEYTADVFIGDGTQVLDDRYEFDERVFFYFHDNLEFQRAKYGKADGVEFRVIGEV